MTKYRTRTGDMLDAICHKFYAGQTGSTERVLEANTGLAGYGPVLPSGLIIQLPDLPPAQTAQTVKLWD
jgi:phage tail protein X